MRGKCSRYFGILLALLMEKNLLFFKFFLGWDEIPEVMGAAALGGIGILLGVYGTYRYYQRDGDNRKYKNSYIVYRPEDPRVSKVHRD